MSYIESWCFVEKNVLIISHSFPPLNNIAARRFGYMAQYFKEHNWNPYILTSSSEGTLPVNIPEENIIRIGRHVQGNVRIDQRKAEISRTFSLIRKLATKTGISLRSVDRYLLNWYREVKNSNIEDKLPKIDLVVATFGPSAPLWLARRYSKIFKAPWIADFRDLAALRTDNRSSLSLHLDNRIERYLLKSASAITTVSETLTELMRTAYNKKVQTIYNGWDLGDIKFDISDLKATQYVKYIYYAGRFYDHRMDSVFLLINALKKHPNLQFVIRSLGPKNLELELMKYAQEQGVVENVQLLPPTNQLEVYSESQQALVNVVFEELNQDELWPKGTLTGKFFELLPLRPPIISIARSDSEMGHILAQTNRGRLCCSEVEISQYLFEILNLKISKDLNIDAAPVLEFYSRKSQAIKFIGLFERVIECHLQKK